MTTPRRRAGLLAVGVLLAGGAWLVLRGTDGPDREAAGARGVALPTAEAPATLAGPGVAAVDGGEAPAARASVAHEEPPPTGAEPADDAGFERDAVFGRIVDDAGRPFGGARVVVWGSRTAARLDRAPLAEASTDGEGRFRLRALPLFQELELFAQGPTLLPLGETVRTGTELRLRGEPAQSARGRVLEEGTGTPVAGARLWQSRRHISGARLEDDVVVESDAEGAYEMPWLQPGRVARLLVERPGYAPVPVEFQVVAERADGYDVVVPASGREAIVEVWDVDLAAPIPDADVLVTPGLRLRADADGLGRLQVDVARIAERTRSVQASLAGWCDVRIPLPEDLEAVPLRLRLPFTRGARVDGRVVDADGAPVAEARVRAIGSRSWTPAPEPFPEGTRLDDAVDEALSGADGRFELAGLVPRDAPLRLRAERAGFLRADAELRLPRTGTAQVEIRLERGGAIEGLVLVDGAPASERVFWTDGQRGYGRTTSNDLGEYRLDGVRSGPVSVGVAFEGRTSERPLPVDEVWVEPGATVRHDVVVNRPSAPIEGRVVDAAGAAVPGAFVEAYAELEDDDVWFEARADELGRFRLEVAPYPAVLYEVEASDGPRRASRTDVAPGTAGLELVLPEVGVVLLRLFDADTGAPPESFRLRWRREGAGAWARLNVQGQSTLSPGPDGAFRLELPVGGQELLVDARSGGYRVVPVDVEVAPERTARVDVPLERGVRLVLSFEGLDGEAAGRSRRRDDLALATVEERRAIAAGDSELREDLRRLWGFRPRREVELAGVAPGRYTLWIRRPRELRVEPAEFDVPAVDRHVVTLRLVEPAGGPPGPPVGGRR